MTDDDKTKVEFLDLLHDFDDAMLVTHDEGGNMRARPMRIADVDADGAMWFVTSEPSGKTAELDRDFRCAITLQREREFLSITGIAEVVDDAAKLATLWRETWRVWFPQGKDAPELRLILVVPEEAEYWDSRGGKGLRYYLRAAMAALRGKPGPKTTSEQHGKLAL